ncbi:hypothetical protein IEQ34_017643 [Dendrobium chrysotoxum]|uniref:Aldehyde dehydrogenase domain-containing protein n=1 Tax=Dendrobium chrysotoxum TaxID=161865 RepID=A0AAV7GC54_DENCH|nr:hypothetical protein IEQ34_017643 [Dendrobium chrysotoxum]
MSAYGRSRILYRFVDLIKKHNNEIAALKTWDNGKPYMLYYASWADKIYGIIVHVDTPHHV